MLKKLLPLLMIATSCLAQNARKDDVAMIKLTQTTSLGTVTILAPVPSALITVGLGNNSCTITSGIASCSPLATICSSSSDAVCNQPNPTNADINGNYGFWLPPGRYSVAVTSIGTTGRIITYDMLIGMNDGTKVVNFPGALSVTSITAALLTATSVVSAAITDTGLTVGNCVQATTGGLLTTSSGPCGTSSGTLTATGSPVAGQGAFWSSGTSVTGSVNWTY